MTGWVCPCGPAPALPGARGTARATTHGPHGEVTGPVPGDEVTGPYRAIRGASDHARSAPRSHRSLPGDPRRRGQGRGRRVRRAGWSDTTVQEPGAISVKPASRTTGNPLPISSRTTPPASAVRTARANPASRQALRSRLAEFPPGELGAVAGLGHRLARGHAEFGVEPQHRREPGPVRPAVRGSSRSVPETWSLASSLGQPSSGTGGKTRTSAALLRSPRCPAAPRPCATRRRAPAAPPCGSARPASPRMTWAHSPSSPRPATARRRAS